MYKTKNVRVNACLCILLIILGSPVSALTIKLGSLVPAGSPWHNALKMLAVEWRSISGNRVNIKIYPGGIAGDEPDMLRKMRINQLQAAALTGVGLFRIVPDLLSIQLPLLIANDEELDYILKKMKPTFEREMERKGFKMIVWTMTGWAHFFSRYPVVTPEDLKRQKLNVPAGNEREILAMKKIGFHVVPLPVPDLLTGLQSGMVDAFFGTPLIAAAFQWFGPAKNMCALRWAPVIGGIVLSTRTWNKIPDHIKPGLMEAALKAERSLRIETKKVEEEALAVMKQHGLVIHPVSPAVEREWKQLMDQGLDLIMGKSISREIYAQVRGYLNDFRKRPITGKNPE